MKDNKNILRFKKRFKDDMRENEIGIARPWRMYEGLGSDTGRKFYLEE